MTLCSSAVRLVVTVLVFLTWSASAIADEGRRWEIGAGFGYVQYQHYPAAGETSELALPFPTFQYRGKVLRAGDRDGAKLYLLKRTAWDLEFSGTGYPALKSSKNEARTGMPDLPWMVALGPQAVTRIGSAVDLKFGVFQAISTDFRVTQLQGAIWEAKANYQWNKDFDGTNFLGLNEVRGTLSLNLKGATKEVHDLYYGVRADQATPSRPPFDARAGFLSHQLSYFQSLHMGRLSIYAGILRADFGASINRRSPLHRDDESISYLAGLTYVFYESQKSAISEESTSGVIDELRSKSLSPQPIQ